VTVFVSEEQPFRSRQGLDRVLLLKFRYDAPLVDTLKRALRGARSDGVTNTGGWLRQYAAWFVEPSCWPAVRRELVKAGYTIEYVAADVRPSAPGRG
jgi:hypothetical protein